MEKLNEYLQTLLSTCSYELHLEPNKIPFTVSDNGATDVANAPLLGTQISALIFPLIPNAVKMQLPNKNEIEFVHAHNLGNFNFLVKKSSAGFNVTIRPALSVARKFDEPQNPVGQANFAKDESSFPPPVVASSVDSVSSFSNAVNQETVSPASETQNTFFESSSSVYETQAKAAEAPVNLPIPELEIEEAAADSQTEADFDLPKAEIISTNDAEFVTTFSDASTYEPPGRASDYAPLKENEHIAPPSAFAPAQNNSQAKARMDALFRKMAEVGASDLHLSVSVPPMIRKDGKMQNLESSEGALSPEMTKELLTAIMPAKNQEEFARRSDTDFAYEIAGLARFRANVFMDRKGMGGVFRIIPSKMTTAEQIGLSQAILNLCDLSKGLVVVTGPTGSGKSTTLCAMINHINLRREEHIITIEDPIEFVHENHRCLVNQREVHNHTDSFKDALRAALREDPDILLVGEMRDLETISIAIETAETGHLVFGTLHTTTAASTVDRIIDQFPADRQQQIRVMLSESLKGVIAQTLLPKKGGGRVAALEVLIVTPAISNLIREGKTFQIPSAMQTGKQQGMVMLNDALFALVQKGLVEPRDAYIKAVDKTNFGTMLTRNNFKI